MGLKVRQGGAWVAVGGGGITPEDAVAWMLRSRLDPEVNPLPDPLILDGATIPAMTFAYHPGVRRAELTNATAMGAGAFQDSSLTELSLPSFAGTYVASWTLRSSVKRVIAPKITGTLASFVNHARIEYIDAGMVSAVGSAIQSIPTLKTLVLRRTAGVVTVSTLALGASSGLAINADARLYVPDSLVAAYRAQTTWSTLGSKIVPLSTLPD